MPMRVLFSFAVCSPALGLQAGVALRSRGTSPFMLVSGVTAPQDLCIVGDGGPLRPRRSRVCAELARLFWQERCCCRTALQLSRRAAVRSCGI